MYFNHALAGAIAVKPIIDRYGKNFTQKENTVIWFIGITSAVLPDFDILYAVITGLSDHRSYVTHGMFLYLLMFLLIYGISSFQKKEIFGRKFFKIASFVFLAGVSTHFLIDFIIGGIAILSPFNYRIIGFDMVLNSNFENRLMQYLVSKYMLIEVLVAVLFIKYVGKRGYFTARVFSLFYFIVATISFVLVSTFYI
jgi:hypothetical protein